MITWLIYCELKCKDMQFGTLEHAYQYVKAMRYGDDSCSENILCCRTASDAKRIGSRVQNFKRKDWDSVKETVMLELLQIKFVPGTILACVANIVPGTNLVRKSTCVNKWEILS